MPIVKNDTFSNNLGELQKLISEKGLVVIDVETNGLNPYKDNQICGIGVGDENYQGLMQYYPFRHHQGENLTQECLEELIECLNTMTSFVGYNIKFDLHFLENEGLIVAGKKLIDVIVMVRLITPSEIRELGLSSSASRAYGQDAIQYDIDTKKVLRSNKWLKDFSQAPVEILGDYCIKDVMLTARLFNDCYEKIKNTNQEDIFNLQCSLTSVLFDMEKRGVLVDKSYAMQTQTAILDRLDVVKKKIYALSKEEFNISSPLQIGEILEKMGIQSPVLTPKGKPSWNEAALVNINHRIAGLIRQHRTLEKLNSTYIEPYTEIDIMRTSFCNWGTTTGRLSSREPNLQNIPRNHFNLVDTVLSEEDKVNIKNKISAIISVKGKSASIELSDEVLETWSFIGNEYYDESSIGQISIRRLFIPRNNYTLVAFDYSQMEVRVFLSYFKNELTDDLLNREDVDFHNEAAKLAFNINEDNEDFKSYRQLAKGITFGTIYGIGNKKLAEQLSTTPKEAGKYKKQYFNGLKGSKEFLTKAVKVVALRGWLKNRYGRRYVIPSNMAYKGVNYLVQGTSADILSERMIEVSNFLENKKSNMLLQVHDEIICEIHNTELDTIPFDIKRLLEENSLEIPLKVDMEICSPSWATKKDFEVPTIEDYIDWENVPFTDESGIEW